jgi:uncharacterized protein (TIGR02001 family)
MKRTTSWVAAVAALAAGGLAHADVSTTITAVSNYDFRGITQTAGDPALSVSLDWSNAAGVYLGAWSSNIDFGPGSFGDIEVDLYGGYRFSAHDVSYDVGIVDYTFHPGGDNFDFAEAYAAVTYKNFGGKLWYAWDFDNAGDSAEYLEANYTVPLPKDYGLTLHAGYSFGDYWKNLDSEYVDYAVGVSKTVGHFALALKWIDGSDLKIADYPRDLAFSSKGKAWFSISTTLPWASK